MNNNKNIGVRIVNTSGKHKLFYAELDESGYVDRLFDELDIVASDYHALVELLDSIQEARKFPVVMLNSSNKKLLMRED